MPHAHHSEVVPVDNAGLPGKSPSSPPSQSEDAEIANSTANAAMPLSVDDIPVALRNTSAPVNPSRLNPVLLIGGLGGLGAIALGAVFLIPVLFPQPSEIPSPVPNAKASPSAIAVPSPTANTLLGHFAYEEAPASELRAIAADGSIKLRAPAAQQFQAMVAAAKSEGVSIVTISGFRSVADQQHLFFDIKAQRGQVATKRAEVSAPPGYSEHHTGYAVDLGDGNVPATNLSPNFENTAAFKWLQKNAPRFSFELSFPRGNSQGVNYEPWHWRFVGDRPSLETFYKAKNLGTPKPKTTLTPSPQFPVPSP
jgi:D-alanyl-D-alanine carboxypeptidase